ncbi:hypothetical protein GGR56DRAFT_677544 [Xylariaceae sp. FL0804]|nr:hypothetical protein GGR56DRAFT_677544 [Xylariaceae sp. FL0804]
MADEELLRRVHGLGDLDLAALLCLIGREHCIVSTTPGAALDDLVAELRLVAARTFGLQAVVVDCTPHTTLDDLGAAIQLPPSNPLPPSLVHHHQHHHHHNSNGGSGGDASAVATAGPRIADVVVARDLDKAPVAVQIQCLELLRTRRIFTRTSVLACPKQFLFVAALAGGGARLTRHLNDYMYISHWHDPEDGFAHLDEEEEEAEEEEEEEYGEQQEGGDDDDNEEAKQRGGGGRRGGEKYQDQDEEEENSQRRRGTDAASFTSYDSADSTQSVVVRKTPVPSPDWTRASFRFSALTTTNTTATTTTDNNSTSARPPLHPSSPNLRHHPPAPTTTPSAPPPPLLPPASISHLSAAASAVAVDVSVRRYAADVCSHLRLHRALSSASSTFSPRAARHLARLVRALAALHGLAFAPPALVALAARKACPHRIRGAPLALEGEERSLQWGSDPAAVAALLRGVQPADVVEDVLRLVAPPL